MNVRSVAVLLIMASPAVAHAQQATPTLGVFQRQPLYGAWSKSLFADSIAVTGPAKTIYLAGMGSEDETTGAILHQGDVMAQCVYAFAKIKKALAAQGAGMADIVKITTYLTDMRSRVDYNKCKAQALGDAAPPTHTLINVSQLALQGMLIEVDATAVVAAK